MAGAGPLTPAEVARRSGTAERYVAEWLKAQAAGGYVTYHPESGHFSPPPRGGGRYDLVVYVDSLHDLGDPVGALAHPRERLAPGGAERLIGRDPVLAVLRAALDAACDGWGRVVLVAGEPGIGKTALAAELAREATGRGARVRDAIARVARQHQALGRHLTDTVSTGTWCAYSPPTPVDWEL